VRYGYVGDTAVFQFKNPKSIRPSKRSLSIAGLAISRPSLDRLFDAVCLQLQGFALATKYRSIDSFLKPFLAYFRQGSQPYPVTSTDWQIVLVNFLRFVLIDQSHSAQSVRWRIYNWRGCMMPAFQFWIEEDIIPCDVQVPGINFRTEVLAAFKSPLLGRSSTQKVERAAPIQKCLREGRYRKRVPDRIHAPVPLASFVSPDGYLWALAIAKRLLNPGVDLECTKITPGRFKRLSSRDAQAAFTLTNSIACRSAVAPMRL
jgi:hypothetical protein